MKFAKVFPLLIAKAERKGRTADEVYEVGLLADWVYKGEPKRVVEQ